MYNKFIHLLDNAKSRVAEDRSIDAKQTTEHFNQTLTIYQNKKDIDKYSSDHPNT
jgi:hypothetical protein